MLSASRVIVCRQRYIGAYALLFAVSACDSLTNGSALDAPLPTKMWFAPVPEMTRSGWRGLPAFSQGLVLIGKPNGILALDVASGARKWDAQLWSSGYASNSSGIAVNDGHACMLDGWATGCANAATGRVLWSKEFADADWRGTTALDESTWYVGSSSKTVERHRVYALDPTTGTPRWITDMVPAGEFKDVPTGVLGTVISGDTVYATTVRWLTEQGGTTAGDLVALDRETGRILWSYTTPPPKGGFQGAALIHGRLAIMNDVYSHALVAVDRFNGEQVWRTDQNEGGYITSERQPVLIGDTLFAASTDTHVYAVDVRTGKIFWRAYANRGSLRSLAVCGSYLLATVSGGGAVVAVDRSTHVPHVLPGLEPGDYVWSQIGVRDNVAIFTSQQGVYAYRCN